ncbi:MAG: CHAP domain-containing protein, partial [Ktedonobacteraceae bacterium]
AQNNYIGPDHPIGPGDILSFGPVTTEMHFAYKNPYGHTSVVTAVDLDENGNGTITTMEENGSANGIARYVVVNWTINTNADGVGPFIGWLHNPKDNPPTPTPTPTPSD